ncbi:unnamed protein product [Clonostachys rosea]|uniref:beta-glucosidase n=1 Tax=Bionectria ochroleuca TaxID=29856 RepID=A0ABY6TYT0_BIOOC|nr:unnamed protein product [Clonostachys rosea]
MFQHSTTLVVSLLAQLAASTHNHEPSLDHSVFATRADNESLGYRNPLWPVNDRVEDLLQRMTLEEKAGQMFQDQIAIGTNYTLSEGTPPGYPIDLNSTESMVGDKHMTHFNLLSPIDNAGKVAGWYNLLQQRALDTRLGIPISLSSDPRHHEADTFGASLSPGVFSQWPESLGLAALRDPKLVQTFAEIAREEYLAVGLRSSLHPQVDLATEPRWARIYSVWSEDAELTAELIVAYIKGFQGDEFGPNSVSTVTKHFPGGGPVENGEDSHFVYGKNQTYPGNNFDYHLIPFKAAIQAGARQIMPYYSRPIGTGYEEVGFGFSQGIVRDLLQNSLGFDGIVLTDWTLLSDRTLFGLPFPARAWGMEDKTEHERVLKIIEAGCDQLGGENRPELLIDLVNQGLVSEDRLDRSVRKLLKEKFLLGLFDNPFLDPKAADRVVGNPEFQRIADETQRQSFTLLSNTNNILPIRERVSGSAVYIEGLNQTTVEARGFKVVATPEEADWAFLRLAAPFEVRDGTLSEYMGFQQGSLEFKAAERTRQSAIYSTVPTIVDIKLDRPVAIPEVIEQAAAVFGTFGASGDAFLDVVLGEAKPLGKLPFDLPRSDKAAEAQKEDVPFDTVDPLFKFGHGLQYNKA